MESAPKVSVIIPMYNVEAYVSEAIRSLLNQSYSQFEVILIDDGSTDSSLVTACNLVENDLRFKIIHTKNRGQSHARNLGLKAAQGEFISFLDPDDTYDPDFLSTAMQEFEVSVDIVSYLFPGGTSDKKTRIVSADEFISSMFLGEIGTVVWNKVFRKSVLVNASFPEGEVHEEVKFFFEVFQCVKKGKIIFQDKYRYRIVRQGNTNSTFNRKRLSVVSHQIEFIEWAKKNNYHLAYSGMVVNLLLFLKNYFLQISMFNDQESNLYRKKSQDLFNDVFFHYLQMNVLFAHKKSALAIIAFKLKMMIK